MEQIEGKQKLLKIAKELIMKNGYNAVSARKIARDAKMSIGTLYYHFPRGKVSILNEILRSLENEFIEINKYSNIIKLSINPELTQIYLNMLIDVVRQYSPILKAFQMELLVNEEVLTDTKNLQEKRMINIKERLADFIQSNIPEFIGHENNLGILVRIILNTVFHHVILDKFYGTDEELKEVLIQLINNYFLKSED